MKWLIAIVLILVIVYFEQFAITVLLQKNIDNFLTIKE
ncbi:uncharacterized protein METZ01_LOCUS67091 [marine metagenome]|uniref:Uncharacterized protein n=1 Tax=marine metagenome TaxID=408172 RepID=A0A381THJ2_9ZZZZ